MTQWVSKHWWLPACAVLLIAYVALAWTAANTKSATYDEPLSTVSAWAVSSLSDYRVDYEHPPLWKRWAWLANGGTDVKADLQSGQWNQIGKRPMVKWEFSDRVLYKSGNDWRGMIMRARTMMLLLAVAGGALAAWWSWRLAGPVAAVVTTGLYCLDPNLLGHGPLVKNDMANAVVTTAILYLTYLAGKRLTWPRAVALCLLCGVALVVKLSAVVIGPIVALLLAVRAVYAGPWEVLGKSLTRTAPKLAAAATLCLAAFFTSILVIWAAYGFRFGVSPDPNYRLDVQHIVNMQAARELGAKNPLRPPTQKERNEWDPGLVTNTALKLLDWRLMPEPWLAGILFTQRTAIGDKGYINNDFYFGGKWYYFLEAFFVKTPVGTLVGLFMGCAWLMWRISKDRMQTPPAPGSSLDLWALTCLGLPAALLFLGSCLASLNLGLRYILPVYPLLFIVTGIAAAGAWNTRIGKLAVLLLGLAVAGETLRAWPNYIAFFNAPAAMNSRDGLLLMGDSNLDWGQDLPAVKAWQERHPGEELYLSYFGTEDPAAWGIKYRNLPAGYAYGPPQTDWPRAPESYMLISATNLQGIYLRQDLFSLFRHAEPVEVLGGTIYVFKVNGEAYLPARDDPPPPSP